MGGNSINIREIYMKITAELNYLRMAPRKVRLAADAIRGKRVPEAERALRFLTRRAAGPLAKLLASAVANAKHNFQLPEEGLYIKNILVNQGPTLKRFMPRAFGRAAPVRKRSSHVSLILDTRSPVPAKPRKNLKKEEPLIRDLTREDIREEFAERPKEEKEMLKTERPKQARGKTTDFVRRVFKRKVI